MANLCFILILNLILNFYFYFFFNLVCVLGGECCEGCTVGGGRVLLCDCNCDVNCFQRLFRLFSLFSFSLSLRCQKKKKVAMRLILITFLVFAFLCFSLNLLLWRFNSEGLTRSTLFFWFWFLKKQHAWFHLVKRSKRAMNVP